MKVLDTTSLNTTFPRGAKAHEYLSFTYKLMKDFKLVAPWAKYDIGSVSIPYASIKDLTQDQYQVSHRKWKV